MWRKQDFFSLKKIILPWFEKKLHFLAPKQLWKNIKINTTTDEMKKSCKINFLIWKKNLSGIFYENRCLNYILFILKNKYFVVIDREKNSYFTECSDWKSSKSNGSKTKTMQIWPFVGKAKMSLKGRLYLKNWKKILDNEY